MSDKPRTRGLGRGLSTLMSDVVAANQDDADPQRGPSAERRIPIEKLHPNPDQPRRSFSDDALEELASSIRTKGIIQPLIVRSRGEDTYEIVAGERRWRAAQRAGLHEVPVLVRELDDTEVLEVAIIENIQRADLNAIDEAAGYRQLMDRFGHTQEDIAGALGKSRSHIANLLRLLSLPEAIQTYVADGKLSAGHARTLVGQDNAEDLAREIIRKGLSVRQAEALARSSANKKQTRTRPNPKTKDADTVQIERDLTAHLGLRVQIDHDAGKESGRLILTYKDLSQLDDILRVLSGD